MMPIMQNKRPNTPPPPPPPEQVVSAALNEQGFLLQHKLATVLLAHEKKVKTQHKWQVEAAEVPVSLANGDETRIDLVLRHGPQSGMPVRALIECKRAARDYKRWIFFAQNEVAHNPSPNSYYTERAHLQSSWRSGDEPDISHTIDTKAASPECPVFDFGVEARLNSPEKERRVSATDAIEDAFQQVTLGQAGLGVTLRKAHVTNFINLPVVATTAELVSAHFDARHVSLDRGMIDPKHVKIEPRRWLAVNFRISQTISLSVPMGLHNKIGLAGELVMRQVRTVFVVQADHVHEFLVWLETTFAPGT